MSQTRLLIVGASARAAAQSAARCGIHVATADLFADTDLPLRCNAQRIMIADYPHGLLELTRRVSATAWMYTGGLENHPNLIERLSQRFPLAGCPAQVLRRVRDPLQLAASFAERAIPHPAVIRGPGHPTTDRRWLLKPLNSTGGRGIRPIRAMPVGSQSADADAGHFEGYWQEQLDGISVAGVFVANGRECRLCGVTQQWTMADLPVDLRPPDSDPYQYVGSVGPLRLTTEIAQQWTAIGQAVTQDFGLRGLFGVDAIMQPAVHDERVTIRPVEVNPRYTASVEVLERALDWPAINDHLAAGLKRALPASTASLAGSDGPVAAKLILFARHHLVVQPSWLLRVAEANRSAADRRWPAVADIPHSGCRIRCGRPVCTLLCTGTSIDEIRQTWGLKSTAGEAQQWHAGLVHP